jgi:hypothetical protein
VEHQAHQELVVLQVHQAHPVQVVVVVLQEVVEQVVLQERVVVQVQVELVVLQEVAELVVLQEVVEQVVRQAARVHQVLREHQDNQTHSLTIRPKPAHKVVTRVQDLLYGIMQLLPAQPQLV